MSHNRPATTPDSPASAPRAHARDLTRLPITLNLRRLSLAEGIRAALSVAVIMAASAVIDWPPLREAALAALLTCICDPGGPVRRRLPVLLGFTLLGASITAGFGLLRGFGMPVALPLGIAGLFCASFARVYGQAPQQLGGLLSTVMVLSLDRPLPDLTTAGLLAAAFVGGGVWATLLTLVIWRLHPYLPARRAVADVYAALARLVADLQVLLRAGTVDDAAWEAHARLQRRAVREAIELARDIMFDTLRARGAASHRGTQSLIRLETAEQMFGALIALGELLEHAEPAERVVARRTLRRLRPLLQALGRAIVSDDPVAYRRTGRAIDALEADAALLPDGHRLRGVTDRLLGRLRIAQTLAVPANFLPGSSGTGPATPLRERLWRPIRSNLDWRSPALRHALRTAIVAAPALAFTMLWFTPYDHWLTITIIATMQPYFALTYARALERIIGTILGGLVAALVGLVCTTNLTMALAMFPLAIVALAVRTASLGLFMIALTPLVVLLVEVSEPGTGEWMIAGARAAFTAIGGGLALAGCMLLWPSRAPDRLLQDARSTIRAHGQYAATQLTALLEAGPATDVDAARREAGLTNNALEASINLALNDPGTTQRAGLESVLVIDAALRRLAGRVSVLPLDPALARDTFSLRAWRDWIGAAMRALADGETVLPPHPPVTPDDAIGRIARQIDLIAGVLAREAV